MRFKKCVKYNYKMGINDKYAKTAAASHAAALEITLLKHAVSTLKGLVRRFLLRSPLKKWG
jgi:hypothetical protein